MGNLRNRFGVWFLAVLALLVNVVPIFYWVKTRLRPYWKFAILVAIAYFTMRYWIPTIKIPTIAIPDFPTVPISFIVFLFAAACLFSACCAFGYVLFTFLALTIKINQALAADVRGVSSFVNKVQETTPAGDGNFYAYDEAIQAGIEDQQRNKREKRIANEEFEKFVKANAGDLNVDMNSSGLP